MSSSPTTSPTSSSITPFSSDLEAPKGGGRPEGWSAPFNSSPYTAPPHPMERSRMILVEFEADPRAMAEAVPAPLELVPGSKALAFIGDNRQTPTALQFLEGAIILKARLGDVEGNFIPYIWTSNDEPMLAGREVSGRPKLMCDHAEVREQGSFVYSEIVRRGQKLLTTGISVDRTLEAKDFPLKGDYLAVRKIVMPELGRASLKQVIHHQTGGSFRVDWLYGGRGQVDIPPTALSAVSELAPTRITGAWYTQVGWMLGWGRIAWESWVPQEPGDSVHLAG